MYINKRCIIGTIARNRPQYSEVNPHLCPILPPLLLVDRLFW